MDWLILAAVLVVQPLLWVGMIALGARYVIRSASRETAGWVDERVEKVGEELRP